MNNYVVTITFRTNPLSREEYDPSAIAIMHTYVAPNVAHVFTLINNQYSLSTDNIVSVTVVDATPNRWS